MVFFTSSVHKIMKLLNYHTFAAEIIKLNNIYSQVAKSQILDLNCLSKDFITENSHFV